VEFRRAKNEKGRKLGGVGGEEPQDIMGGRGEVNSLKTYYDKERRRSSPKQGLGATPKHQKKVKPREKSGRPCGGHS